MTSFMSGQRSVAPRPSPAAGDNRQVWSAQTAIRPKNCHRNHFPARVSQPWLRSCLACKTFLFQNLLKCTCLVLHQSMLLNSLKCQKFFETFQQKQFQRNGLDRLFHTYKSFLPRLSSAEQHVAVKSGLQTAFFAGERGLSLPSLTIVTIPDRPGPQSRSRWDCNISSVDRNPGHTCRSTLVPDRTNL